MKLYKENSIAILDFGSQYTQLIARRVREFKVYCEIFPYDVSADKLIDRNFTGVILSGGPRSVYDIDAPICDPRIFRLSMPILGICYGMQLIAKALRGRVVRGRLREYGNSKVFIDSFLGIFKGLKRLLEKDRSMQVWMSHGDAVTALPQGFMTTAYTRSLPVAAFAHERRKIYGVQFHPEVTHTTFGSKVIRNFLFRICHAAPSWTMQRYREYITEQIQEQVGDKRVISALSGGIDSAVTSALLHSIIGDQLVCVFIDNGLLREGEVESVRELFEEQFSFDLEVLDLSRRFLTKLKAVTDPEKKRKIIGQEFISAFEERAKELGDIKFLAQGTLYPDRIESTSVHGPSAAIKSHHNVGGLPEKMKLELIEPLKHLYKDEVRLLASELGFSDEFIYRHPFPGPGLAVRILGEVNSKRLKLLRTVDKILIDELKKADLYNKVGQAFAVLLPVKTVGVMGDERTYENAVALRVVDTSDFMTADWSKLPYEFLSLVANRIINEVKGVNRVVYDITSKPPGTVEWE